MAVAVLKLDPSRSKVLITGASGFVGRAVCELFLKKNYIVYGLSRRNSDKALPTSVIHVRGDLQDVSSWQGMLSTIDVVVHCAGNARFGNGDEFFEDNVVSTQKLLKALSYNAKNLKRIVFISSIAAMDRPFGDSCKTLLTEKSVDAPSTDYGKSKVLAEELIRESGLPFVIIRPAQVIGKTMRFSSHFAVFARWVLDKKIMNWFAWPGVFSVLDVEDLASAILICSESDKAEGNLYLCGGHHLSVKEFFEIVKQRPRIEIRSLSPLFRFAPFPVKSLFFPCMKVDDSRLNALGWVPHKSLTESLDPLIDRERARRCAEHSFKFGQSVITGAGSGLGKAFVEYLAPRRKDILLVDRNASALNELTEKFKNCRAFVCDLGIEEEVDQLLSSDDWNRTNVIELFACAGYGRRGSFSEDTIQQQIGMIKVNMISRMKLAQKAIPNMLKHQFGRIVLISSSSAFQALPGMTSYAASNAGLLLFGEGLSYELKSTGVAVLTACPGGMKTGFQKYAGVKELKNEKLMLPDEVVRSVMLGLNSKKSVILVSFRSKVMSLASRVLPRKVSVMLWGWLMARAR